LCQFFSAFERPFFCLETVTVNIYARNCLLRNFIYYLSHACCCCIKRSSACCFVAVGCGNLVPPSKAWLRRTDNEATIGCYTTHQRWNLRCHNNRWIGTIGVCSDWGLISIHILRLSIHLDYVVFVFSVNYLCQKGCVIICWIVSSITPKFTGGFV